MSKTAGIIIIGDEILSGKVQEENAFFMARELWAHGIAVSRISVIPDSTEEIAQEVRSFASKYDYVFTSGGIGPTHDDVTIEGVSKAFAVPVVIDEELRKVLAAKLGNLSAPQLRMAEVPEGAETISDDNRSLPIIKFRNVFVLPGIPQLFRRKFLVIERLFSEPPFFVSRVYLKENESILAPVMNRLVDSHRNVKIGSYPVMENSEYTVMVTLESSEKDAVRETLGEFLKAIDSSRIFRVEE